MAHATPLWWLFCGGLATATFFAALFSPAWGVIAWAFVGTTIWTGAMLFAWSATFTSMSTWGAWSAGATISGFLWRASFRAMSTFVAAIRTFVRRAMWAFGTGSMLAA